MYNIQNRKRQATEQKESIPQLRFRARIGKEKVQNSFVIYVGVDADVDVDVDVDATGQYLAKSC